MEVYTFFGSRRRLVAWGPPHPRCARCQRYVGHHASGYGDGLRWCERCALQLDAQRPAPPSDLPTWCLHYTKTPWWVRP